MKTIDTLDNRPFRHLITTIGALPTSFIDSMSYYEMLAWLCDYLEKTVIPAVNENAEVLKELQTAFVELKEYVDNYFANLDIQTEIDNKLDEMAESGQLADIIAAYLQLKGVLAFNTVADITDATNLVDGSFVKTYGYLRKGDGVYDIYKVRPVLTTDNIDGYNIVSITADPTLIAERLPQGKKVVVKMIATDDIADYLALTCDKTIILPEGITYTYTSPLFLNSNTTIDLNTSTIQFNISGTECGFFTYKLDDTFTGYNGNANITIKDGKILDGCISMLHNKNVTIENVEFETDNVRHTIQFAGCYNVIIRGCIFNGTLPVNDHGSESINIDPCNYGGQPYAPEDSPMFDMTPNSVVLIDNNTFKVATDPTLRNTNCVGTHGRDASGGLIAENVVISNNDFTTSYTSCINVADWKNVVIENNTCASTARFIIRRGSIDGMTVHNNSANVTISFFSTAGNSYPVTNVQFTSNQINSTEDSTDSSSVIQLIDVQHATVSNNTIKFQNHCFYVADKASWDGDTYDAQYRSSDITYANNTLIKTSVQDSYYNNRIRNCDNVRFIGNKFLHPVGGLENNYEEFLIQATNTGIEVQDNFTDNPTKFINNASIANITSGFRNNNALYEIAPFASGATSRSGTFATSTGNFSKFVLTIGSGTDTQTVELQPFLTISSFKMDARTWKLPLVKSDNTFGYFTFTVNSSDEWTYSGSLALRSLYGKD